MVSTGWTESQTLDAEKLARAMFRLRFGRAARSFEEIETWRRTRRDVEAREARRERFAGYKYSAMDAESEGGPR